MGMGVMDLAVEIYKDENLKKLVESYIEQRDQKKEPTTKAAGVCAISHNEQEEMYKENIAIILNKTHDIHALRAIYTTAVYSTPGKEYR